MFVSLFPGKTRGSTEAPVCESMAFPRGARFGLREPSGAVRKSSTSPLLVAAHHGAPSFRNWDQIAHQIASVFDNMDCKSRCNQVWHGGTTSRNMAHQLGGCHPSDFWGRNKRHLRLLPSHKRSDTVTRADDNLYVDKVREPLAGIAAGGRSDRAVAGFDPRPYPVEDF